VSDLAPTARLRFVERTVEREGKKSATTVRILQQFWALDVPSYMRGKEGQWRDVPLEVEYAPP
jgi:hypothetical protein